MQPSTGNSGSKGRLGIDGQEIKNSSGLAKSQPCTPGLEPVTFSLLSRIPGLAHGVFTRHGGVSLPPYGTLNVAWNNGDSPGAVSENLRRVIEHLGIERLVSSPQVHGDLIREVDEAVIAGALKRPPVLLAPEGDGLMTSLPGVGLMIKIADCQAVFLVDPEKRVIANVHCGWRGSVKNIAAKAVRVMESRFGSKPKDIYASISPSLGPCCAEFINYNDELPEEFLSYRRGSVHFDFWAITRDQLLSAGLRAKNIEAAAQCTVCGKHDYFSYRGERVTGRMAAVIGWKAQG